MSQMQRESWEHEIPLIEKKPLSSGVQPVASIQEPVHRKSLSVHNNPPQRFPSALRRPPTTYTKILGEDHEQRKHDLDHSTTSFIPRTEYPESRRVPPTSSLWLPRTLRRPSLLTILALNIVLLVLVVILHWVSATRSGLGTDDGSSAVFFGWRFTPTLIAVIYVFCSMMLLEDVKRTEVFARLASKHGASASASILQAPGPWWSVLWDSFPGRKNDHRLSWTMLCAVSAYILGFLVISPFSSALLAPKEVAMVRATTFRQVRLTSDSRLRLNLEALDYFQTVGHILQNVTTSAWITDEFSVLSFWPSSSTVMPSGAALSSSSETWKAETVVFQSELNCESMTTSSGPANGNYSYGTLGGVGGKTRYNSSQPVRSLELSSPSRCKLGFAIPSASSNEFFQAGGSFWSNLSSINTPDPWYPITSDAAFPGDENMLLNHTSACEPGEIIVAVTKDLRSTGQICRQSYYSGNVTVTASLTETSSLLTFDKADFSRVRVPISQDTMDVAAFQEAFLGTDWNAYMVSAQNDRPATGGPSNLLAALYNFTMAEMILDGEITAKAAKIKQRAFGEALQTSFKSVSDTTGVAGQIMTLRRRIVVSQPIAITLEVVLFLQMLLLVFVYFYTQSSIRRLGLFHDPAYSNTIVSLLAAQEGTQHELKPLYKDSNDQMLQKIGQHKYGIMNGALQPLLTANHETSSHEQASHQANGQKMPQWKPILLTTWAVCSLAFLLAAVLIAVAVLYWFSTHDRLYQSAFVYQTDIEIGDSTLGTLAPYSIIPTLVAVMIGLWWGSVESVFRTVQPYIAMAGGSTVSDKGSGLSYQSSYLVWAAYRAGSRKHWLLALVCTGAFLSQILTITMSALWQREPSQLKSAVQAFQNLQLRQIPHLFLGSAPPSTSSGAAYVGDIVGNVFDNLMTNWMYGAAIQLSLNGPEPSWSSNGWSFVPVNLPSISAQDDVQDVGSGTNVSQIASNVTLITPAIRGRLECTPWDSNIDSFWWLTEHDLTNATVWNTTYNPTAFPKGYELGCKSTTGPEYLNLQPNTSRTDYACDYLESYTNFRTDAAAITCCGQGSADNPGTTSIGFWSPNLGDESNYAWPIWSNDSWPLNFTVKWIQGHAVENYYQTNRTTTPHLIWPQPPVFSAINCQPIIETANASVTVDISDGYVQNYSILNEPELDSFAWADIFVQRTNPNTTAYEDGDYIKNVTTSYGIVFLEALLSAASLQALSGCPNGGCGTENLNDRTFNIRRPGLNVDYMTYSMLSLAGNDTEALLDPQTLSTLAQKTFSTFFQHFASNNVTTDGSGGWVYQRVNDTLPADLGVANGLTTGRAPARSSQITNATTMVTIVRPVEVLRMSSIAVWLSLVILLWLIVTTVLIIILKKRYFSPLLRGVDTVADVAVMVAGSERLLKLANERGPAGLQSDKNFKTRLGWFRTSSGEVRWGIELDEEGVEFLTEKDVKGLAQ